MKYKVQVNDVAKRDGYLQGLASVTFDDAIKVTGVKMGLGKGDSLFIGMPNYKAREQVEGKDDYKDICFPVTKEFRDELYQRIFDTFDNLHDGKGKSLIFNADDTERINAAVRVTPILDSKNGVKALATVVINEKFALNNISLRENGKGELFVAYPSYKTKKIGVNDKPIYQDVFHPVTKKWREKLDTMVKAEYQKALDKEKDVPDKAKEQGGQGKTEQKPKRSGKTKIA